MAIQDFLGAVNGIAPADHRNVAGFDADLVEYVLDALSHEIAQTNNCLNLVTVSGQVIRHMGDHLGWIEFGFGDLVGYAQRLKYGLDTLSFERLISRAGDLHWHPNEVALFNEIVINQILCPTVSDCREVGADIGLATASLVIGIH